MIDHSGVRNGTNEIPKDAFETPNFNFSIMGMSSSGKTNYITVMLNELMHSTGNWFAMNDQTNDTRDLQKLNYSEMRQGRVPPGTLRGDPIPQIWKIKNLLQKGSGFFSRNHVPTYTFTIYDGAGEDHLDPRMIRYIRSSEAFIIVLDPLMLEGARNYVDPGAIDASLGSHVDIDANANTIVERLSSTLLEIKGLKAGTKLNMPIAVVLTKFDTVINHPAFANAMVRNKSLRIENGKVREEEFEQIHNEIEHWLKEIGEQSFINSLNGSFATFDKKGNIKERHYNFFAVSSYGQTPDMAGSVTAKLDPHRVLDPILWLFKKKKFID